MATEGFIFPTLRRVNIEIGKFLFCKNNLETVDYWTKKLTHHSSSHILHSIFWTNLINKKTILFSASTAVVPTVIRLLFYLLSLHFVSLHTMGSETSSPFFACPFGQNKSSLDNKIKKAQMTRYIPGTNRHSEIISNKKEMPRKTSCCFLVTLVEHNNPSMWIHNRYHVVYLYISIHRDWTIGDNNECPPTLSCFLSEIWPINIMVEASCHGRRTHANN